MNIDLSNGGVFGAYLTYLAVLSQLSIFFWFLWKLISIWKSIPSDYQFEGILERAYRSIDQIKTENPVATMLLRIMGSDKSAVESRSIIHSYLVEKNDRLRQLINIPPAVGLLFTFGGMFFIVMELARLDARMIEDINVFLYFENLYPVFIGGAFGMLLYSIGLGLLNLLESHQQKREDQFLYVFLHFEKTHEKVEIHSEEDAYRKLLKSVRQVGTRFENLSVSFVDLTQKSDELIRNFTSKTESFVIEIGEQQKKINQDMLNIVHGYESVGQKVDQWNNAFVQLGARIYNLTSVFDRQIEIVKITEERFKVLQELIVSFNTVNLKLDTNTNAVSKLSEWIENDRLLFNKVIEEMRVLMQSLPQFAKSVETFSLTVDPLRTRIEGSAGEIVESVQDLKGVQINFSTQVIDLLQRLNAVKINHTNILDSPFIIEQPPSLPNPPDKGPEVNFIGKLSEVISNIFSGFKKD